VRLGYASDLPTPEDLIKRLQDAPTRGPAPAPALPSGGNGGGATAYAQGGGSALRATAPAPLNAPRAQAVAAPGVRIATLQDMIALAQTNRDIQMKVALERDVRPVRIEPGSFEFSLAPGASPQIAQTLMRKLSDWTGERWMVAISTESGAPTIKELSEAKEAERMRGVRAEPLVRSVLERFPGAEIIAVRGLDDLEPAPAANAFRPGANDDVVYADTEVGEDSDDDL
jgi:DNA polymerase-3 subunit gamma/tau